MTLHEWWAREAFWLWPLMLGHLWQATLFAVFALLALLLLKRRAAKTRHTILLVALLKFAVPSALLAFLAERAGIDTSSLFDWANQPVENPYAISQFAAPLIELTNPALIEAQPVHNEWLCALTILWLTGCGVLLGLWWMRRFQLARAMGSGPIVEDGRELQAFERARSRLALKRHVRLIHVAHKTEPGVWRTRKPIMVLPERLADHLTDDELEAVMLHELAHVERWDNFLANIQTWICCVLWFHPLVWLVDRKLLSEREQACDERVLETSGLSTVYASSILKVCRFCIGWKTAGVSGVTGSNLRRRIEHIMAYEMNETGASRHSLLIATTVAAVIVFTIATGLFSRSKVTAQNNSAVASKSVAVVSATVSNETFARGITFQQTEDTIKGIEQAPEGTLQFENLDKAPLVITDAKIKVIPRELFQRVGGEHVGSPSEADTYGALPTITLKNVSGRRITRIVLAFISDQKEVALLHTLANIEPGGTYTHKADLRGGLSSGLRLFAYFPNPDGNEAVKVRGGNFDDESGWGMPTPVFRQSRTPSAANPPQPPSPSSTVAPPQPPGPPAAPVPSQPSAPPAAASTQQPPAPPSPPVRDEVFTPRDISDFSNPPTRVSGGVLNGKAIQKPTPVYPQEAKDANASGPVTVQILIDEEGKVVEAKATRGHPLLHQTCVDAAYQARFAPTRLKGQPVKVSGLITYNFVLQK